MRALEKAEVPIGWEAGKGYFIMDGYHLPPVIFSSEEAINVLVSAEKLPSNHQLRFEEIHEVLSIQVLHIGSYFKEQASIEKLL